MVPNSPKLVPSVLRVLLNKLSRTCHIQLRLNCLKFKHANTFNNGVCKRCKFLTCRKTVSVLAFKRSVLTPSELGGGVLSSLHAVMFDRLKDCHEAPADVASLVNIPTDITRIHCLANLE